MKVSDSSEPRRSVDTSLLIVEVPANISDLEDEKNLSEIKLNANRIRETYRCLKKNSIVNWINNGVDFNPALIPCIRSECARGKIIFFPPEHRVPRILPNWSDP
jgi:hypothetical protein